MNSPELKEVFRKLGARDPDDWARSQIDEGIPQLARFLFLRQAWRLVVDENDTTWIAQKAADAEGLRRGPFAGIGHALKRLRALGAVDEDIVDLVRGMQAELLFRLCYLLEDPGNVEPEVRNVRWSLFQVDEQLKPLEPIRGLHESVLGTDPTGREMPPR